jgi:glutathione S-transferase
VIELLGRLTSINVRKVLWALDELGEPYERQDWGLPLRDPNVPEFLALNPNAQVPVLVDADGTTMWESNAILVYLAQTRGKLLPTPRQDLATLFNGWAGRPQSSIRHGAMRSMR